MNFCLIWHLLTFSFLVSTFNIQGPFYSYRLLFMWISYLVSHTGHWICWLHLLALTWHARDTSIKHPWQCMFEHRKKWDNRYYYKYNTIKFRRVYLSDKKPHIFQSQNSYYEANSHNCTKLGRKRQHHVLSQIIICMGVS